MIIERLRNIDYNGLYVVAISRKHNCLLRSNDMNYEYDWISIIRLINYNNITKSRS